MFDKIEEVTMQVLNSENEIVTKTILVTDLAEAIKHIGCWENEYSILEDWQQFDFENLIFQ